MFDYIEEFLSRYDETINLITFFVTFAIAVAAFRVSHISNVINKRMERSGLYEKRKEIFDVAYEQLGTALFHPEWGMSRFQYFMRARTESKLIFDPEVYATLVDIGKFVTQMYNQHNREKRGGTIDAAGVISFQEALDKATSLADRLDKHMESYLKIVE